jgi:hypothetical protein
LRTSMMMFCTICAECTKPRSTSSSYYSTSILSTSTLVSPAAAMMLSNRRIGTTNSCRHSLMPGPRSVRRYLSVAG